LTLRHLLTSFGHTVNANVFLQQGAANLFVTLHGYANHDRAFLPGMDVELVDYPVAVLSRRFELSPRAAVWAQPAGQAFRTRAARAGGLAGLRARTTIRGRVGVLAEIERKGAGWVAGIVQLDPATNVRLGASAAGLALLRAGTRDGPLVEAHRRPQPPYPLGPVLAAAGATAMCDVSDGLAADLGHVARASGVSIGLHAGRLRALLPDGVTLEHALHGGEDHALAATLPAGTRLPAGVHAVGRVDAGPPVVLLDGEPVTGGWEHFA
jgi:hypothetical protein